MDNKKKFLKVTPLISLAAILAVGIIVPLAKTENVVFVKKMLNKSGSQIFGTSESILGFYPENKNGLTYGGGVYGKYLGTPDLIAAYGTNRTLGYIYARDLDRHPSNPQEALNLPNSDRYIPLYDKSGKKIIGQVRLGSGTN